MQEVSGVYTSLFLEKDQLKMKEEFSSPSLSNEICDRKKAKLRKVNSFNSTSPLFA